ncbi:MAG: DUF5777 family beta-barrel protein [Ginsengibacter sp.]
MFSKVIVIFFSSIFSYSAFSQDSTLMQMLEDSMSASPGPTYVTGTFNGTTIVNQQTVELPAKNVLLFMIMHRFGKINDGAYNFFGLDNATLRLGLDYGITNRLSIGVGRSSLDKTFDASVKYKLLRQDNQKNMPISLNIFASIVYPTLKYSDKPYLKKDHRKIYTAQLIAARKFGKRLSLQFIPTWMHFNLVPKAVDKNDIIALGIGGRIKITKRTGIIAECNYVPSGQFRSSPIYYSFSKGIEFETGGHVFQLIFTNSDGMVEPYYIAKTTGRWGKGDIYFGFNVSRVFNLKK